MTDVILIHPDYPWPLKYPPMGIAYLASYLEQRGGYSVRILDLAVKPLSGEMIVETIRKEKPALVGFSFMTCQAKSAYELSDLIRGRVPGTATVAGGIHASALPEEALPHFDYLVRGEGERALRSLSDFLIRGEGAPDRIPGLYHRNGSLGGGRKALSILELDDLPFPAWHLLPLEDYRGLSKGLNGDTPFMVIVGSRGCPNYCVFCASHLVHGKRFRFRSPENILEEISQVIEKFGIRQFDFADDTMTISGERMMRLCDLIQERELDIAWDCNARVNTIDLKMLKAMKGAGCVRINFGVESGDPRILKRAKKGYTLEQIRRAHSLAKKAGLKVMSFFMLGLPGENLETMEKTYQFAKDLPTDYPGLTMATPFPGTPLFALAERKGWLDGRPWEQYTTTISGPDFTPVMRTDELTRDQILDKYRKVVAYFREVEACSNEHFGHQPGA